MPQRKLLIVEDNYVLYEELCEFFEEEGFSIIKNAEEDTAVASYEEAVQLMKQQRPDIALLDIHLTGEKDGIDLGIYIRQQYYVPVVYLSERDNDENIERLRKSGQERFVYKSGKPVDKRQLRTTFKLALQEMKVEDPDKAIGRFFNVKEMQVEKEKSRQPLHYKNGTDPVEIQTFVKWDEVLYIESYNTTTSGKGNNNVLMHTSQPDKTYIIRTPMDDIEERLHSTFVRFSQSTIVNMSKVTAKTKTGNTYFIGDRYFRISDVYKARALAKIRRILGEYHLQNIPEL